MNTKKHVVILYTRPGCHLCEEAKQAMHAADCADAYTLEEINIVNDPNLLELYKTEIPVITIDGIETFKYRLTPEEFRQKILR